MEVRVAVELLSEPTRTATSGQITFMIEDGVERCEPATSAAVALPVEDARPVRCFPSYRGQRNFPGLWWAATLGRHVGYESWLERDHAMLLDFDPRVVGFSSQPMWVSWCEGDRRRRHAPDFFARLEDGTGVVIDCRPESHRPEQDAEKFSVTSGLCAEVGWRYLLVGEADPVLVTNVRWLAGYRHPRYCRAEVIARLLELFSRPTPLLAGCERVGDSLTVLPVLFHLLWQRRLGVELAEPLREDSFVFQPAV